MIKCAMINQEIEIGQCVTIVDICNGCIKKTLLPKKIKNIKNWEEVCKNCEYHNN